MQQTSKTGGSAGGGAAGGGGRRPRGERPTAIQKEERRPKSP